MEAEERRGATAFMTGQLADLGAPATCEVVTRAGDAVRVIADEAGACAADVTVLGAHRRQILRDVFTGTTAERVTRTSGRPVPMAQSTGPRRERIFIATDMSETSAHAARTAHALGLLDGAEVTVLHAHVPVTRQMMTHAGIPAERVQAEAERGFQTTRREFARFLQTLVLGTRGLSGVKRLFLGSVARELMGSLEVDMLAVPPKV